MRQISCAICGIADEVVVYRSTIPPRAAGASLDPYAAHYQINRCRRCDLVYSSPILDEACVAALYTNSAHGSVAAGEERNAQRTMELYYELVRPHLSARRRVLDIGCDVGFLLKVARGDGFAELHGIEPNPVARAEAAKLPGAVVYDRFYETQDFPDAYFDLVTLVHVVDHLVDPGRVLARARRHLRPGGVILAVVHDVRSPLARLLGERFPPYNLYHHYFFSKVTLARLFERSGFETIQVTRTVNCYSLGFLVERTPLVPLTVKRAVGQALGRLGFDVRPLTVALGNIGIVAHRPMDAWSGPASTQKEDY